MNEKAPNLIALSLPVMAGYIPLGAAFGYIFAQQFEAWYYAPIMSVFIYAGAAQFLAIGMLSAQLPLIEIFIATVAINLRHIFYGLPLLSRLPDGRLKRLYLFCALTDESYSLFTANAGVADPSKSVRVFALNHTYWISGTIVGALAGVGTPQTLAGIEFCLTALFTVLVVEQAHTVRDWRPFALGLAAIALALVFMPENALFVALCLSSAVLVLDHARRAT